MLAIKGGKVFTMSKAGVIDGGIILIENGKIKAIGKDLAIPEGAQVISAGRKVITPGIIDAHCHAGIGEEGIGFEGRDYNEVTDPTTPHLRAIDAINPEDLGLKDALGGGITTICTGPGSANVIGGEMVAMKTYGRTVDDMIVKHPAGLKSAFGENPKRVYAEQKKSPVTRMATAAHMREAFVKAQNYLNKIERAQNDPEKMPDRDLRMEAIIRVLKGEIPLRAHAHRADDILTAIRIAEEFGIKIVLEHCTEGHKIADIIAAKKIPAIVGPTLTTRSKYELKDRSLTTPGVLARAGVKIAIMTDHPVIPLHILPIAVGIAVREGLPKEEALKTITINPAEIIGVADRVGSLEKGKDADIVIWSGDPTETATKAEKVFVNGELVVGKK